MHCAHSATALLVFLTTLLSASSVWATEPPTSTMVTAACSTAPLDESFEQVVKRYLDEMPAFSPVSATALGDHRFDDQLDQISQASRQSEQRFCQRMLADLQAIDRLQLSRQNQVDYLVLRNHLQLRQWELDRLQEWAWNPLLYTQLAGSSVYGLMAREFAPVETRVNHVAARLEQLPRFLRQVRETLVLQRVPPVHAETAIKQNRGVLNILEHMVLPHAAKLSDEDRGRLERAIARATAEVVKHENWLQEQLLPQARGDFRIGPALFDEKLQLTLATAMTRAQIKQLAHSELRRVRGEMYMLARQILQKKNPATTLPRTPTDQQQQATIQACLDLAYADAPGRDQVLATARSTLKTATDFVREQELVSIPDDPLEIIVMPEFQRGVSVAYCDSPGALEVGQKTFYAVAPLPETWTDEQCASFLREYNVRSIHNLTIHEAMPGHFLQLAHANRCSSKLRAVAASGVFIEGWACYTEQVVSEAGYLDGDPLMRLITLKWYLRSIANALLDQAIHVDGIDQSEAMRLMVQNTFQEEREAAGKWTRAQLTSVQLSTYFVGYQEHRALRRACEEAWGERFKLKQYHDQVLSFGSPPVRYVQALMLDQPITE